MAYLPFFADNKPFYDRLLGVLLLAEAEQGALGGEDEEASLDNRWRTNDLLACIVLP